MLIYYNFHIKYRSISQNRNNYFNTLTLCPLPLKKYWTCPLPAITVRSQIEMFLINILQGMDSYTNLLTAGTMWPLRSKAFPSLPYPLQTWGYNVAAAFIQLLMKKAGSLMKEVSDIIRDQAASSLWTRCWDKQIMMTLYSMQWINYRATCRRREPCQGKAVKGSANSGFLRHIWVF